MKCPACEREGTLRVISCGLPMGFCPDCEVGWGPASWLHWLIPLTFTGEMFVYSGSYLVALWYWLNRTDG